MAMSEKQKEDLAWATRIITIALLGIASAVGMSVYTKVDEMYSDFKLLKQNDIDLKERQLDLHQELRQLSIEFSLLKENNHELRNRINQMTK